MRANCSVNPNSPTCGGREPDCDDRAALRRDLLARRAALPCRARLDAALDAALRQVLRALRPASIGAYCATRGEYDPLPLLAALQRDEAALQLALPVVDPPTRGMHFAAWRAGDALRDGPYGIAEPARTDAVLVPALLLLPCVGFAEVGLRLGYGGGYYDRYLAGRDEVFTVGLAFEACRLDHLHAEPHDQLLDLVLTERAAYGLGADLLHEAG